MKSNLKYPVFFCCLLCAPVQSGFAQDFINLDFESPAWVCDPTVPVPNGIFVSPSIAMPGWTAYSDGSPYPEMLYNTIALAGEFVSIIDANGSLNSISIQ